MDAYLLGPDGKLLPAAPRGPYSEPADIKPLVRPALPAIPAVEPPAPSNRWRTGPAPTRRTRRGPSSRRIHRA